VSLNGGMYIIGLRAFEIYIYQVIWRFAGYAWREGGEPVLLQRTTFCSFHILYINTYARRVVLHFHLTIRNFYLFSPTPTRDQHELEHRRL